MIKNSHPDLTGKLITLAHEAVDVLQDHDPRSVLLALRQAILQEEKTIVGPNTEKTAVQTLDSLHSTDNEADRIKTQEKDKEKFSITWHKGFASELDQFAVLVQVFHARCRQGERTSVEESELGSITLFCSLPTTFTNTNAD